MSPASRSSSTAATSSRSSSCSAEPDDAVRSGAVRRPRRPSVTTSGGLRGRAHVMPRRPGRQAREAGGGGAVHGANGRGTGARDPGAGCSDPARPRRAASLSGSRGVARRASTAEDGSPRCASTRPRQPPSPPRSRGSRGRAGRATALDRAGGLGGAVREFRPVGRERRPVVGTHLVVRVNTSASRPNTAAAAAPPTSCTGWGVHWQHQHLDQQGLHRYRRSRRRPRTWSAPRSPASRCSGSATPRAAAS